MIYRRIAEFSGMIAGVLFMVALYLSLPQAIKEIHNDRKQLRGHFGLAFCMVCIGSAIDFIVTWVSYQIDARGYDYWNYVRPLKISATWLVIGGLLLSIRAITTTSYPSMWIRSFIFAALASFILSAAF